MKTLFITLILIYASITAYSQVNDIYFKPEKKSVFTEMAKEVRDQPTEIAWIKSSLSKYHNQRKTGFILQIIGVAATTSAFFIKDEQYQKIAVGGGAVLSLSGLITIFAAEKHLKAASLPPTF